MLLRCCLFLKNRHFNNNYSNNNVSINNFKNYYKYSSNNMYFSTTNSNNNTNNNITFFKNYTLNSNKLNLEERKNYIESFLLDAQGTNKILLKERIKDDIKTISNNNSGSSSSDIIESFIKMRDDLEKYNCLPVVPTTSTSTTSRLSDTLYSFDTMLGELIKENLKDRNQLYCKPLDIDVMPVKVWRQIIENEAVHPYENITNPTLEIRERTTNNKTCLILFHPLLPTMPLMSLYIAFTNGIPNTMDKIENNNNSNNNNNNDKDSAIFYSISSLHKGLGGVNLGQILITKAVEYIRLNKPEIKNFCTLSPLPRLKKFLSKSSGNKDNSIVDKIKDEKSLDEQKLQLQSLALSYIYKEKNKTNRVFDPVCNFHLKNGASIYRLNWYADQSEKRIDESFGIMINYLYEIDKLEKNSKNYIENGTVEINEIFNNQLKNNKF